MLLQYPKNRVVGIGNMEGGGQGVLTPPIKIPSNPMPGTGKIPVQVDPNMNKNNGEPPLPKKQYDYSHKGQTVRLSQGESFSVMLSWNDGNSAGWVLNSYDQSLLGFVDRRVISTMTIPASVTSTCIFKALEKDGETNLSFLKMPKTGQHPMDVFTLKIIVGNGGNPVMNYKPYMGILMIILLGLGVLLLIRRRKK